MAKTGRKSKYYTHVEPNLTLIKGWARDGLSEKQIRDNLHVAYSTFREYKKQYSAFSAALKTGKEPADFEVENALFKKATGFEYEEVTTEEYPDGSMKVKTVKKQSLPDTTAIMFWLKNRKSEKWKDRKDIEQKIDAKVNNPLEGMTVEELEELLNEET